MRKKRNNNLVAINYANGEKLYYTSYTRAGYRVGLAAASVQWACEHGNTLYDLNDKELTISLIDGSNVQYKYINN